MKDFISVKFPEGIMFINIGQIVRFCGYGNGTLLWLNGIEKPLFSDESVSVINSRIKEAQ